MILRELSEDERAEFQRIKTSSKNEGYQILMGLVAIDLLDESDMKNKIDINILGEKITDEYITYNVLNRGLPLLPELLTTWIKSKFSYKGLGAAINMIAKPKGLEISIYSLVCALSDAICQISYGMIGKKQRDMWNFFREINEKLLNDTGYELSESPEEIYRYIMTCLEFIGFERKPSKSNVIVDVSCISYNDICSEQKNYAEGK